ncbi:hypothetical protein RMCBS344292_02466 [Rhizopus microsporus]|nr:hypothetical protein RMCBS344292_02466 [Rhizopus microsporus]
MFALSTFLCCLLLLFTLYPSLRITTYSSNHRKKDIFQMFDKGHAYATIICDNSIIEPTLVSIYSLQLAFSKKPSSKADVIVLIPDSIYIENDSIQQLERLDTKIIRTSFAQSSCMNSQHALLNLWAMFDYKKIVYFTHDVLFDKDVDQLFYQLPNSAILSNQLSPSLLLLEPSPDHFESMVRDYKTSKSIQLQLHNNTNKLLQHLYVYNGPMKPWNFHMYNDTDWSKHYDPIPFYYWRKASNGLRHFLNPVSEWKNQQRQDDVCDGYLQSINSIHHFTVQDKFSVMISTYNPERIERISLLIRHLLKSDMVHTIYITWHNPNLDVPASIYDSIQDHSRLKVLKQSFDSLNNRFNPVDDLKTEAVYIMDDDIFIDLQDLEYAFNVWRSRKDSVVGHFPRLHRYDPETHQASYKVTNRAPYTLVLTKSMFIRSEYLFAYTCLLEPKLHEYVDQALNCEDLGFAMMASGLSHTPSTFVCNEKPIEDFGRKKGISINNNHMPARADCISNFITQFWNEQDPLLKSYDAVAPFARSVIKTGNWARVETIISNE